MPERRLATTGTPLAMASMRATGMPSILPLGSRIEGSANAPARPGRLHVLGRPRSEHAYALGHAAIARTSQDRFPLGPVAHELQDDLRASLGEQGKSVDEVRMALLGRQAGHAHHEIGIAARQASPVALKRSTVDTAMDDLHTY